MKIGIVVGSVRDNRLGAQVGQWVADNATGATFETIDVLDFDLPFVTGPKPPAMLNKEYADDRVSAFSKAIDDCQGFIFVTPEYNASVPGAFKNAIDHLYSEWHGKPVGYVVYSYTGGKQVLAHWQDIMGVLKAKNASQQVSLNLNSEIADGSLRVDPSHLDELNALVNEIIEAA